MTVSARSAARSILESRSAVLLVGQSLFPDARGKGAASLRDWWLGEATELAERARVAREIGDAVSVPESVSAVMELNWSSVVTSSFDSTLERALTIPKRRHVTQIASPQFSAAVVSANTRLVRLFGTLDRDTIAELPPVDKRSLSMRRNTAVQMLAKLPELVGPRGALAVTAWDPMTDWMRPSDLALSLVQLASGQVHVFGISEAAATSLAGDADFGALLDDGVVQLHHETLESVVVSLSDAGEIPEVARELNRPDIVTVSVIKGRTPSDPIQRSQTDELVEVAFDALPWRELSLGQLPIRELDVSTPLPSEPVERYQIFHELLSRGVGHHNLRYIQEIAFARPALADLILHCVRTTQAAAPQEQLTLVRGQTGSGKSVLLCQLAAHLRSLGLPVVYVPSTTLRLDALRVEAYARRVGEKSEAPVFVLFDGLLDEVEYRDIAETFAGRATKCALVGTCYTFQTVTAKRGASRAEQGRTRDSRSVSTTYIDVDVNLDEAEAGALIWHIERFVPTPDTLLRQLARTGINHLFVALYQSIPESRARFEQQFRAECLKGAGFLERLVAEAAREPGARTDTVFGEKLRAALAGKLQEQRTKAIEAVPKEGHAAMSKATEQLFNAVMLATRCGLLMPHSIALRMLSMNYRLYSGAFTAGLLDEREIAPGTFALAARSSVEAEIWVRQNLPQAHAQMEVIRQIATHFDQHEMQDDQSPELNFLVSMLRAVGPQGRSDTQLRSQFNEIANLVASMRARHKSVSPRLSLIEAHAVREWIMDQQRNVVPQADSPELQQFRARLTDAETGLRDTSAEVLEREEGRPRSAARRLIATLETERACTLGTMIGSLRRCLPQGSWMAANIQAQAGELLRAARDAWRYSLRLDGENVMSLDAPCWIIKERDTLGFPPSEERIEWLAEWAEMIDRYSAAPLTSDQETKREERMVEFQQALGNVSEVERIVERVRAKGSAAADQLLARQMLAAGDARGAYEYLERHWPAPSTDRRVARIRLRAFWQWKGGHPTFFPGQRTCLPFDRADWTRTLELTEALLAFEPESANLLLLRALAKLHLDRVAEAAEELRELDRLALGGARRSKILFLRAGHDGSPVTYTAVYQGKHVGTRLFGWCDAIRQNVVFLPQEHGRVDVRSGSTVGPFHLGVSFRGFYADPLTRAKDV